MDLLPLLNIKNFYKITGTPENFLTAFKHMIWGFNEKNKDNWKKIMPGDIIFFHSKRTDSLFVRNPVSCLVGFGVVADSNFVSNEKLWIDEVIEHKCKYPYRFKFSEFYTFSSLPDPETWDSQSLKMREGTVNAINVLLRNAILLENYPSFPKMGSYEPIRSKSLIKNLLSLDYNLDVKQLEYTASNTSKGLEFNNIENAIEGTRYGTSLLHITSVKKRMFKNKKGIFIRDPLLLEKSEESHVDTVNELIDYFRKKGFDTLSNKHVDLFVHNDINSFLIEVKSLKKSNRRVQLRNGLIQLLEYDYFEVNKFLGERNVRFKDNYNLLVTSKVLNDTGYSKFINKLNIHIGSLNRKKLITLNNTFDFNTI